MLGTFCGPTTPLPFLLVESIKLHRNKKCQIVTCITFFIMIQFWVMMSEGNSTCDFLEIVFYEKACGEKMPVFILPGWGRVSYVSCSNQPVTTRAES